MLKRLSKPVFWTEVHEIAEISIEFRRWFTDCDYIDSEAKSVSIRIRTISVFYDHSVSRLL